MAGILLTAEGLDLSKYANGMVFPHMESCAYMQIFGQGVDLGRNLAPGRKRASVVGSPTASQGANTFNNQNYIQTDVDHTEEYALVTVARAPLVPNEAMIVSNYGSPRVDGLGQGNTNGMSLMFRKSEAGYVNLIQFIRRDGQASDSQGGPAMSNEADQRGAYVMHLASTRGTGAGKYIGLWDATKGMRNNSAPAGQGPFARGSKLRIGAGYGFGSNVGTDIAFVALWNRQMLDAELVAVRDFARRIVSFNGIVA